MSKASTVSATTLAQAIGVDRAWIGRLVESGVIHREADGRFKEREALISYIAHLRSQSRQRAPSAAHAEYQKAKAEELQLRVAERLNQLVPAEVIEGFVDFWLGPIKSELAGIPARVTRDIALRRQIEIELDSFLHRLADRAERGAAMAEQGVDPLEGEEKPALRRRKVRRSSNGKKD